MYHSTLNLSTLQPFNSLPETRASGSLKPDLRSLMRALLELNPALKCIDLRSLMRAFARTKLETWNQSPRLVETWNQRFSALNLEPPALSTLQQQLNCSQLFNQSTNQPLHSSIQPINSAKHSQQRLRLSQPFNHSTSLIFVAPTITYIFARIGSSQSHYNKKAQLYSRAFYIHASKNSRIQKFFWGKNTNRTKTEIFFITSYNAITIIWECTRIL